MKIVESLIEEISTLFDEYSISEEIDFKISHIQSFDYQINNLVKYQKNKKIDEIVDKINVLLAEHNVVEDFEITKNYFLNIRINLIYCHETLSNIKENLLSPKSEKILIDYGGPNIGKPLHVGHLRSLNIGRSLKELNKILNNN